MSAGTKAPHLAQTGMSIKGTSQGRPDVVAKVGGIDRDGSVAAAPCETFAQFAIKTQAITPIVGPKLDMFFLTPCVK